MRSFEVPWADKLVKLLPGVKSIIPRLCNYLPSEIIYVESTWTYTKIAEVWALKQRDERTITEPRDTKK